MVHYLCEPGSLSPRVSRHLSRALVSTFGTTPVTYVKLTTGFDMSGQSEGHPSPWERNCYILFTWAFRHQMSKCPNVYAALTHRCTPTSAFSVDRNSSLHHQSSSRLIYPSTPGSDAWGFGALVRPSPTSSAPQRNPNKSRRGGCRMSAPRFFNPKPCFFTHLSLFVPDLTMICIPFLRFACLVGARRRFILGRVA